MYNTFVQSEEHMFLHRMSNEEIDDDKALTDINIILYGV